MNLSRGLGCGVSERDHRFVELDDHLAYLRDLALWRYAQRSGGVGAMRGAQQTRSEHGEGGKHRQWPALFFYVADHRTRSREAKTLAILPECYVILANCFHLATRRCKLIASSARLLRLNLNWLGPCADAIVRDVARADSPPVEKQSYARHAKA